MDNLSQAIKEAIAYLGENIFANLQLKYEKCEDIAYLSVKREGNDVLIKYGEKASLFRGLSLIKENIHKDHYHIEYHKHFHHNGVMHDCSRNAVLNIKQAKEMVLVSSLLGLNRFLLYIEDIYEMEGEPYFGYLRGRYTKAEIKELCDYASLFGVEIVPCIQTLSHLNQAVKWTCYADRRESMQTLLVDDPITYTFIEKMLKTIKEMFTTDVVHIGMDEAFDLGLGIFTYRHEVIDKTQAFLRHLNRVVELCKKYELKPMMWEDMFFQLNAKLNGSWYDIDKLSDDVKALIPDVGLVYWDYNTPDVATYDKKFKMNIDTGKEVIYAGGAISWIGFIPNICKTLDISRAGLKSAIKNGIKEVFVTSWGDDGGECTCISDYVSMALYSTFDFEGNCSNNRISSLLKAVFNDSFKTWKLLESPNDLNGKLLPYENNSYFFFFQDPLLGLFDTRVKEEYSALYKDKARELKKASRRSEKLAYVYSTFSTFCSFLEIKVTLGVHLRKAYKDNDRENLKKYLLDIKNSIKRFEKFEELYRFQWLKENKPQGYEVTDGRFGFLKNRLKYAYFIVNEYLNNRVERIPELEETIIPFDGVKDDEQICNHNWQWNVSTSKI